MRKAAIPGLLVLAVLRLPSLMEPHWYTDEAGYLNVARQLLQGKILYLQTWNNKPPLMLWTFALDVKLFGTSEIALHVLTLITGAITVAAVVWAASRLYTPRRALIAGVIAGAILGLPIVDAELALPESLLIAPLTWAGAIILVHILRGDPTEAPRRFPVWPLGAGVLMAAAVAYQQTSVAETSAFFFAMLLAPKVLRRDAAIFIATVVVITLAWLTLAISTAGLGKVAFALAGFYVDYTKTALPKSAVGGATHFALAIAVALAIAAGAVINRHRAAGRLGARALGRFDAGRHRGGGAAVSPLPGTGRGAAHPARCRNHGPVSGAVPRGQPALAHRPRPPGRWSRGRDPDGESRRGRLAADPSRRPADPHTLSDYYGGAAWAAFDPTFRTTWLDDFDYRVDGDAKVAAWVVRNGFSGDTAVVWSYDAWIYALANLQIIMPTPPIYNDEVLLGSGGPVETYVAAKQPVLIMVDIDSQVLYPEILKLLDSGAYIKEYTTYPYTVWVRADSISRLP